MLEQMRQATKNPILLLAFGILIVVFALYFGQGTEMLSAAGRQLVATVDGEDLYTTDVDVYVERFAPRKLRNNEADLIPFQQNATEIIALMHVLEKDAKAYGIDVTDAELGAYIQDRSRNPDANYYAKDGEFDAEKYKGFASNYLRLSLENYENLKRRELIVQKYLMVLTEMLAPLPKDVETMNMLKNTKVVLEYIALDPKKLESAIEFSDAEVQAFAQANPEKIQKYYDDNKDKEFTSDKEIRFRRLIINKPTKASSPEDTKKANEAWATAQKRAMTDKEEFAKVVKDLSNDTIYKEKGGDMGWSKRSNIDIDTGKVLDKMKVGEVAKHENPLAWFLFKLEEVKESKVTSLDEVRAEIAQKLIFEKEGKKRIADTTKTLLDLAKADPKKSLEEVLTSAKPKAPAAPADGEEDKEDSKTPAPKDASSGLWDALKVATTTDFMRVPRRTFRFDPETKSVVNAFTPWTEIPGIGDSKELALAAFELTAEKPLVDKLITINDTQYIVRLKERKEPTKEDLTKSRVLTENEAKAGVTSAFVGRLNTFLYQPQDDIKKNYPWLYTVLEQAKTSGRVNIRKDVYVRPPVAVNIPSTSGVAIPATPAPAKK